MSSHADDCAICLTPLRGSVQSLQCGHIYHARCLKDAAEVGHTHCAVCRQSIGTVRTASARAATGSGYRAFVAPAATTRLQAQREEAQLSHRPRREEAGAAGHRTPDPRSAVLASVARSLPSLPDSQHAGADNYIFVLDISFSMGRVSECSAAGCSRLGMALCYLACFVSSTLRPEDRYRILAFDREVTDLLCGWQARGAGFDRLGAMDGWGAAIRCVRTGGSNVYTAVLQAHALLAEQAKRTPWEGPAHTLIALTDGEAGDESRFEDASAALRNPDCPGGGFRALLLKIDDAPPDYGCEAGRRLQDLGTASGGTGLRGRLKRGSPQPRPEHVVFQEVPLPAVVEICSPIGQLASAEMGSAFRALSAATPSASRRL